MSSQTTMHESTKVVTRTWKALSHAQRRALRIGLVATLGASGLAAVFPVLVGVLIDDAVGPDGKVSLTGSLGQLTAIVIVVFLQQALTVVQRTQVENAATAYERDQRDAAYVKHVHAPVAGNEEDRIGELVGGGNRAIEGAVKVLKLAGLDLTPALLLAVCAIFVAYLKNPIIATVMLGVLPTGLALVWLQVTHQKGVRVKIRDAKSNIDGRMTEILFSIVSIRTTGAEGYFTTKVREVCEHLRDREYDHHKAMARWDAAKAANEGIWLLLVLAAAIALATSGHQTIGEITAYMLLFNNVLNPIRELHRILDEWSESTTQAEQHFALLDSVDDIAYAANPPEPPVALRVAPAAITCEHVRFSHRTRPGVVLDGVSFEVIPGEHVGLVGPTGCGKSTLLQLLERLTHGFDGVIKLFGIPLERLDRGSLNAMIGYVPQSPEMFRGTIAENITLGDPSISTAELERAARLANIHEFIVAQPAGYDTQLTERAKNLSGGQQQRICLARALVRNPRILLLDEPTAALDVASERQVTQAIEALDGMTVVSVAHRLQTLRNCDRILVMDQGQIVQTGPFARLASVDGMFADLLRRDEEQQRSA